jgi:hypothetical protein
MMQTEKVLLCHCLSSFVFLYLMLSIRAIIALRGANYFRVLQRRGLQVLASGVGVNCCFIIG